MGANCTLENVSKIALLLGEPIECTKSKLIALGQAEAVVLTSGTKEEMIDLGILISKVSCHCYFSVHVAPSS